VLNTLTLFNSMEISPKLGGWRKDIDDSRDLKFSEHLDNFTPIEDSSGVIDLRKWCPPVENQRSIGSCFVGETLIPLLNGKTKTLAELYQENSEFWVYSCTPNGKIVPGKARCNLTGLNRQLIRVTLDNNEEIVCTPEHQFMLRNGTFCEARQLTTDMSLMPFYRKLNKFGYELVFDNQNMTYHKTHNVIAYHCNISQLQNVTESVSCVHHIDFDKNNNEPSNLKFMGLDEHFSYHASLHGYGFRNYWGTEKHKNDSKRTITNQYATNPQWNEGAASKGGKQAHTNRLADPQKMENFKNDWQRKGHTPEARAKARKSMLDTLKNLSLEEKIKRSEMASQRMKSFLSVPENKEKQQKTCSNLGKNSGKTKLIYYAQLIIEKYGDLTESFWSEERKNTNARGYPKFSSISKYFDTLDDLRIAVKNRNHKIKSIDVLAYTADVYCLSVDVYHNFALHAGVFVHNCAANSVVSALEILQIKAGEPYRHLSRLFLYYNARLTDGDPEKDVGTYLRTAYATLTGMGTCTEAAWPYDTDNVFLRPSWDAYRDAYPNKINSYYRIAAYGKDLRDAIVRALEAQHPVSFGMIIDRDFMQNTDCDGVVAMPKETRTQCGGHAMLIVGCKDYGNTLIVRNSWGTGWGDQGYCYVPFAYLEESNADDFWVPFALKTV